MEAYEKGLITKEDTDGIDLKFGNAEGMIEAVRRMCLREGKLGALIADGASEAARRLGKDSEKFAMVNKDMEWGAYSLRVAADRDARVRDQRSRRLLPALGLVPARRQGHDRPLQAGRHARQ